LESVIDAASYLKSQKEIQLTFVGDGVKKPQLQERARAAGLDNVAFLPYTPKDQLIESFAAADVFIISLKKGLGGFIVPSKLYGILAAGRPFVASVEADTEVASVAAEFECGLLATPGDPLDLAEKVRILYSDADMRRRFGDNARRAALRFDRKVQV